MLKFNHEEVSKKLDRLHLELHGDSKLKIDRSAVHVINKIKQNSEKSTQTSFAQKNQHNFTQTFHVSSDSTQQTENLTFVTTKSQTESSIRNMSLQTEQIQLKPQFTQVSIDCAEITTQTEKSSFVIQQFDNSSQTELIISNAQTQTFLNNAHLFTQTDMCINHIDTQTPVKTSIDNYTQTNFDLKLINKLVDIIKDLKKLILEKDEEIKQTLHDNFKLTELIKIKDAEQNKLQNTLDQKQDDDKIEITKISADLNIINQKYLTIQTEKNSQDKQIQMMEIENKKLENIILVIEQQKTRLEYEIKEMLTKHKKAEQLITDIQSENSKLLFQIKNLELVETDQILLYKQDELIKENELIYSRNVSLQNLTNSLTQKLNERNKNIIKIEEHVGKVRGIFKEKEEKMFDQFERDLKTKEYEIEKMKKCYVYFCYIFRNLILSRMKLKKKILF